jgi:hypothetical protein
VRRTLLWVAVVVGAAEVTWADYLKAGRHAILYSEADRHSTPVGDVNPGDILGLESAEQDHGYYRASGPQGEGWVYRTMVRRYAGDPPQGGAGADIGFTTGKFRGCPPQGDGGDPELNRLKNRDLPPPALVPMTLADLLDETPEEAIAMGKRKRSNWTAEARSEVAPMESLGVQLEGYLLKVKKEGKESCNCHSAEWVDYHLWLAESPDATRVSSIVVEVSPRSLPANPSWTGARLQKLVTDREKVRISGWVMWDQEHPEQVGATRGTQWEVHPIHRIEVRRNGQWTPLDN